MEHALLGRRLQTACQAGDEAALARLAGELGFHQAKRTATNLRLLFQGLGDGQLLSAVIQAAGAAADPDLALNNLERLSGTIAREELAALLATPALTQLLTILGASPFLSNILCRRSSYVHELFAGGELQRQKDESAMLAELRALIPESSSFADLQKGLRQYKAREILRIGGRDLCGLAGLAEVTGELAALAAATLHRAYEVCDRQLRAEHGAPILDSIEGQPAQEAEFTIFGMGKFGGRELNFSSDIDLIYFYSSEKGMSAGVPNALGERNNRLHLHRYFCKLAELISKAIGQATEDGFVFRVDLNLRPEGSRGEMAISLRGAETYYEAWGQSWERAAMLKGRPVAGSPALGQKLLKSLEPFVYRKHLDYGMLEDIKTMKQKIDHNLTREREGELNLKLGRGGIREIEFFIQALQLIYAGKKPELREKNSLKALALLRQAGLLRPEDEQTLREAYIFLRSAEHRIQVVQERQTHNLPTAADELRALGRRCGFPDAESFQQALQRHRAGVSAIYHDLFFTEEAESRERLRPEVALLLDRGADVDLLKDLLEEKGFKNPDAAYETIIALRDGPPHSHLTERSRRRLERIAPLLLQEVLDSPEPDMALRNLERFLLALRARATFYALLAENPAIIKMLVGLFGTSQFLSRIFIQHPEILDSLVSRSYAVAFKEPGVMAQELAGLLGSCDSYEDQLDLLRRYRNEEFLRIALNDIHGHTPQGEGTFQLSALADLCLNQALVIARAELLPRFGLPFCKDAAGVEHEAAFAIIGMGKLGGMELNYHSDLDIIFIYEGEGETRPVPGSDPGRFRRQSNQEYFSRLAQRIISVLTLMTREGYVYQIDTRLRPSGNQGPLVTSLPAYERYHQSSAQAWERQALTKARVVAGPAEFARRISETTARIVYERPLPPDLKSEIYRLRGRMEAEIAREGEELLNIKTGRGGMVDVEFLAQYMQLVHGLSHPQLRQCNTLKTLEALQSVGLLSVDAAETLGSGYKFLRRLENKLRLVHDQSINEIATDRASLLKLARRLGYPERPRRADEVLREDYNRVTEKIRALFDQHLGPDSS